MADNWYETYFGEEYLRLYGAALTPEREAREVDAIVAVLGLEPGAAILDLCCGQGRHLVPLAQRGYQMTGLDLSEHLLGIARSRAEEAGVAVEFHQSDMREIPWAGRFDAVINMFTAFGYFDDEAENQKVLHAVHRALKPGGKFLLDTMSRDRLVRIFLPNSWEQFEDGTIAWYKREFDFVTGINTQSTTYRTPDGALHHRGHRVRIYTPTELCRMLREARLEPVTFIDVTDGSPYTLESRRLTILSVKESH